ncbi:phosphate regulon sensor histidine kinase PhoR [Elongatibacter sediminis]|uniref:Phosphate regulon sensor protein PhoR n=1 Tax=Elongatibacter sediminis TaxID=3119006 RepID=A0AAW9RE89_9GAMM
MTSTGWKRHFWRLLAALAALAVFGVATGWLWQILLIALAGLTAWNFYNLWRLNTWLDQPGRTEPAGNGIWGRVFDGIRHVTESHRHQADRYESRIREFQDLTHSIPDATLVIGENDEITWGNQAAQDRLGLKFPADLGQAITHLVRVPGFSDWLDVKDHVQGDFEMPSPTNDSQWLQVSAVPIESGRRLIVFRDITRVHNLEQVRRDFVANISHELRTPVTVILGYLELLQDPTDDTLSDVIERMQSQAVQMRALLDDLLELSRLQSDEIQGEEHEVDVPALLGQLKEQAEEVSRGRHHIRFEVDPEVRLSGVASDLESAFRNLIMNAINYTPEEGEITVVWCNTDDGPKLAVRDTGIGIPSRHIPRLTERFYRVGSDRARQSGGTGLGLAIVKHVLNAHRARLLIHSELGEGSEFVCQFPRESEFKPQRSLIGESEDRHPGAGPGA